MKGYINNSILFFAMAFFFFFLTSCNNEEDKNPSDIIEQTQNTVEYNEYKYKIEVENSGVVNRLFDSIGYKIVTWVVNDRIKYTLAEQKPEINFRRLDSIKKSIDKQNNSNIKAQVDKLISKRKAVLMSLNTYEKFSDRLDDFLNSSFYNDTILSSYNSVYPVKDSITYNKNKKEVKGYVINQIKKSKEDYKNILSQNDWDKQNVPESKISTVIGSPNKKTSFIYIKENWLQITLLMFSLLFNVLLLISNKNKSQKNKRLKEEIIELSNNFNIQTSNKLISKTEIQQTIDNEYQKLKNRLIQKYQMACFNTQSLKFEALMTEVKENAQNNSFKDKQVLLSFIDSQVQKHESSLENELKNCLSKDKAIEEIQASILAEEFTTKINDNFISTDELRNKVEQYKNNLVVDLSETITRQQLTTDINKLKQSIEEAIERIVKSRFEIYLPFADARGFISDDKRSGSTNEYSALKLSIDPNDITKATFQLLYNQSEMMRAAIMSYDTLLLPICILKGENFNRNGYKIEQIGYDGTMKLEDGKWRVINKLEIKVI